MLTSLDHYKRINFPPDKNEFVEFSTRPAIMLKNFHPTWPAGGPDPWTSLRQSGILCGRYDCF